MRKVQITFGARFKRHANACFWSHLVDRRGGRPYFPPTRKSGKEDKFVFHITVLRGILTDTPRHTRFATFKQQSVF